MREQALHLLDGIGDAKQTLTTEQAVVAWALALASRHLKKLDDAEHWISRAVDGFEPGSDDHTLAELTHTGVLAFQGRLDEAAKLLRGLCPSRELHARVRFQMGAVAEHRGDLSTARDAYSGSLEPFRETGDSLGEAHALTGLGLIEIAAGEAQTAMVRFGLALSLYAELDLPTMVASARCNLGRAAARAGELVVALDNLSLAATELKALGEPFTEVALDRTEALLAAGLHDEAISEVTTVLPSLTAGGAAADRAEALLFLGRALGRSGDTETAQRIVEVAAAEFIEQGRDNWALIAELRGLELCAVADPDRPGILSLSHDDAVRVAELAQALHTEDAADIAADADVLVTMASHEDVLVRGAMERLSDLDSRDPRWAIAQAVSSRRSGASKTAVSHVMDGLRALRARQARSASLEVRTGMARQFEQLWSIGAAGLLDQQDARGMLDLLIVTTGGGLRSTPVQTGDDVSDELRQALQHGATDTDEWRGILRRQRARGSSDPASAMPEITTADEVSAALNGTALLSVWEHDGQLVSMLMQDDQTRFLDPVPADPVVDASRRWHLQASRSMRHEEVDPAPVEAALDVVRGLLPMLDELGDAPVVVLPIGRMMEVPWTNLTRSPARVTLDLRPRPRRESSDRWVIVAGPGLASAPLEAQVLHSLVTADRPGDALLIEGVDATPVEVVRQSEGAAVLHLCTHGSFARENPLLSAYALSGGNLVGYEIEQLHNPPVIVVAAACDAGRQTTPATGQTLGLVSTWLAAGSQAVIAPRCVLPDDDRTVATMTALHASLLAGEAPEVALRAAQIDGDPAVAATLSVVGPLLRRT